MSDVDGQPADLVGLEQADALVTVEPLDAGAAVGLVETRVYVHPSDS